MHICKNIIILCDFHNTQAGNKLKKVQKLIYLVTIVKALRWQGYIFGENNIVLGLLMVSTGGMSHHMKKQPSPSTLVTWSFWFFYNQKHFILYFLGVGRGEINQDRYPWRYCASAMLWFRIFNFWILLCF